MDNSNAEVPEGLSPYSFRPHWKFSRTPLKAHSSWKTTTRSIAILLNHPRTTYISEVSVYTNLCFIQVLYYSSKGRYHRRLRMRLIIRRADVIDPFVWDAADGGEFVHEVLDDIGAKRQLLIGKIRQEYPYVTIIKRYSVKPPNSINNHSIAVFTCKQLPEVQFKLDKTLDGLPPFYTLRTMDNQIIPANGHEHWNGPIPGRCMSWHQAFYIARIHAVGYWRQTGKVV